MPLNKNKNKNNIFGNLELFSFLEKNKDTYAPSRNFEEIVFK